MDEKAGPPHARSCSQSTRAQAMQRSARAQGPALTGDRKPAWQRSWRPRGALETSRRKGPLSEAKRLKEPGRTPSPSPPREAAAAPQSALHCAAPPRGAGAHRGPGTPRAQGREQWPQQARSPRGREGARTGAGMAAAPRRAPRARGHPGLPARSPRRFACWEL